MDSDHTLVRNAASNSRQTLFLKSISARTQVCDRISARNATSFSHRNSMRSNTCVRYTRVNARISVSDAASRSDVKPILLAQWSAYVFNPNQAEMDWLHEPTRSTDEQRGTTSAAFTERSSSDAYMYITRFRFAELVSPTRGLHKIVRRFSIPIQFPSVDSKTLCENGRALIGALSLADDRTSS